MLRDLTATTERSTDGTAPERARDGASRAGNARREGRSRAVRSAPDSAPRGVAKRAAAMTGRHRDPNQQVVPRPRSSAGRAGRSILGGSGKKGRPMTTEQQELAKAYVPAEFEGDIYERWL